VAGPSFPYSPDETGLADTGEVLEPDEIIDAEEARCTCTWGSFVKFAGGTGWDISKFDPDCPVHGDGEG
jgi:hypothetical protein